MVLIGSGSQPGTAEAMRRLAAGPRYPDEDATMRGNSDLRETLPAVTQKIPTLFLWGESDQVALFSTGRRLQKLLPDLRLVFIPDAGHPMQVEQPDLVARYVRKHIASIAWQRDVGAPHLSAAAIG